MRLEGLIKPLRESDGYKTLISGIEKGRLPAEVLGLSDSSKSYLIYTLFDEADQNLLVITHSDVEARNIYEDLSFYTSDVYYFPAKEVVFYNVYAISGDIRWERLKVIHEIAKVGKKIIVTCVETLATFYIPLELYKKYTFNFEIGETIKINELEQKLIESGYERVDMVEGKGQFSIRGGIFDIYSPVSDEPYRIELFGDEIDSIRNFSIESQRSMDKAQSVEIFPAKEIILDEEHTVNGYNNIVNDLEKAVKNLKSKKDKEIIDKMQSVVRSNLESLQENGSFETIDSYVPYFYDNLCPFIDYIRNGLVIIDDIQRCKAKIESVYYEFQENFKNFLEKGDILPGQCRLLAQKDRINDSLLECRIIILSMMSKELSELHLKTKVDFTQTDLQSYHGRIDLLIKDIKGKKDKGYMTVILSGTRARGERLVNTLMENDIESVYRDVINEIKPYEVIVTFGSIIKGFEFPKMKLCIFSDKEVFGEAKKRITHKFALKGVSKIKSFTELKPGDYVVHVNHGIGMYKGIRQLEIQGIVKDYLELVYDLGDKLYVPVEQLDMVQKYIGSEGNAPKVSKLGSDQWIKAKNKARKSVQEIAQDLVKLYAIRSTAKGYAYNKDTEWQKQFEEEFAYEETPDQLTAIDDIKRDMESNKPMDRLLCGDVGYGKTEVAVRAAFKAVMDGKQVAFLVPTTILAQQHYNNMIKRFSDFPIKVDMISRFRTSAEQKATIRALKDGEVDIVVGTHRILQRDIEFKDLGLLIVDEEQRFGVAHKEKIKKIKKNVDVLTLSATPIPRTLHMSLTGIRDISVIETPPEERYPIQTYVAEYSDQLIRDAILREINRGGQVYFIYNRVEKIQEMAAYIKKLVPEARVNVAHGQMAERELENVISDFTEGKFDILVSTTIVETGMDIQNVNTMIIYNADKFGLSQLYQLRGRVGRTNKIAYCYMTYKKDKVLTEVAEKRLKAIKDFTELGSGFKIALKDLEIRGAGNMMGAAQHGHMAAVGYDLYCRMLEDTVKLIKGEIQKEPVETTVDIKVDAYIPSDYINDELQKIEIYKKIAAIDSFDDMTYIRDEIIDRYSDIPPSVNNLIDIAYIKSLAKKLGIEEVKEQKEEVIFKFENKDRIDENIVSKIMKKHNKMLTFKFADNKPCLAYKTAGVKNDELLGNLRKILEHLNQLTDGK